MAMLPPIREITPVPVSAVSVPPQVLVAGVELLIVIPNGKVSVNEKPLSAVSTGAVKVNNRSEFPPLLMVAGVKDLAAVIPAPVEYTVTGAVATVVLLTN